MVSKDNGPESCPLLEGTSSCKWVWKPSFLQKQSMLHQTQASLWVCTGCESTGGTPQPGRKIPVPACSSWVCFWAKLHGNSRLQLASVLHCALGVLWPFPWNLCQMHLDSKRHSLCVWLCRQAEFLPGTGPAALQQAEARGALLVCAQTYLCQPRSPDTAPPALQPGSGGCRGDSCFPTLQRVPVWAVTPNPL